MGSNFKHWLNSNRERGHRQKCYHRSSDYDETEYTLLQDCYDEYRDGDFALRSQNTTPYYEKILEPGDTLLSLSLQFNCPVAELKRINGILRDNEIFARRSVKVPVRPGSIVSERLAGVHASGSGSKDEDKLLISFEDPTTREDNLSKASSLDSEDNVLDEKESLTSNPIDYLSSNTLVANILTQAVRSTPACTNEPTDIHILNAGCDVEDSSSPLVSQELPKVSTESSTIFRCSGADWGLKWPQLLICSLLLGFAGPILYVLYIADKYQKSAR